MDGGIAVGLQKTSLVDYPGRVAAVIFFPHCNLRCPWCHNRELVAGGNEGDRIPLEEVFAFLEKRRAVLGAVVLSGGESLLQAGLGEVIARIHSLGLLVKLDTNGTLPAALERLLAVPESRPDYIAMDLKTAPSRYGDFGPASTGTALAQCAELLRSSGIAHEFRSLALPRYMEDADLEAAALLVGSSPWFFGAFKAGNCLEDEWNRYSSSTALEVEALVRKAAAPGRDVKARG